MFTTSQVVLFSAIQLIKASALCYRIHPDNTPRQFDFHVSVFTKASQCIVHGSRTKVVQWLGDKHSCRKSERLLGTIPQQEHLQALVMTRVNDNYCHAAMSPGAKGRYPADGNQYAGTYDKDDCRKLCQYTMSCLAVTYCVSDRSCIMFNDVSNLNFERNDKFVTFFQLKKGEKRLMLNIMETTSKVKDMRGRYFKRNEAYNEEEMDQPHSFIFNKSVTSLISCTLICVEYDNCSGIIWVAISKPYECLLLKLVKTS